MQASLDQPFVEVWAPSNIALIKYMGKIEGQGNRPTNASLSYSLEHLKTYVRLEASKSNHWQALSVLNEKPIELSEIGLKKFLAHAQLVQEQLGVEQKFLIRSRNNFPADCGLASSASSFAALTMAIALVKKDGFGSSFSETNALDQNTKIWTSEDLCSLSALSRKGSGSSCRSLFSPWAIWKDEGAEAVPTLQNLKLDHIAVVVDSSKKAVTSSEAHRRVSSSLMFKGRIERAETRIEQLLGALAENQWGFAQQIVWEEFWDMHALFETSRPNFSYMTPKSLEVLRLLEGTVGTGDGPMITMDAGANIHLLFKKQDSSSLGIVENLRAMNLELVISPELNHYIQQSQRS